MPIREQVAADYQTLRLSLKAHPVQFFRRSLAVQGYSAFSDLHSIGHGSPVKLAGLVLIRQRPGSAKGVCFITLEDETGTANLVIWPGTFARFRKVVMTARLIDVKGRVQRGDGVTHIIATRLADRSDILLRLSNERPATPTSDADGENCRIPATRQAHLRNADVIPKSRDFH